MSLGFMWRAGLALIIGFGVGFLALRLSSGGGSSPPHAQTVAFVPRLSLVREATQGELVSLQVSPFEVGENTFRVTRLDVAGRPQELAGAHLRFSRLESEGEVADLDALPSGASWSASFVLSGTGWWEIAVTVSQTSNADFDLTLPQTSI